MSVDDPEPTLAKADAGYRLPAARLSKTGSISLVIKALPQGRY